MLETVAAYVREAAADARSSGIPGYVAGVYQGGEEIVVADGVTNLVTRAAMGEETGFLLGSVTKVMTTTMLLRQVERGTIGLDDPVTAHLPEFRLAPPSSADEIRVLNLLNHTNGIDADLFFLDVEGTDSLRIFVEQLGRYCGSLFAPGEYISYSNGGMLVAGRLLEVVTGQSYDDLLEQEIYENVGMTDSCTTAEEAILRSTAVGHFPDPQTGAVRRTDMFKLPDTWSAAGGTPVVTIRDLLAFARTHLADGVSPLGTQVLSKESAQRMRVVTRDMGTPNVWRMGLGWPMLSYGETTVLWHSGASPGGVALLALVPDHDLAFAAFGNDPRAWSVHSAVAQWIFRNHLRLEPTDVVPAPTQVSDLARYEGTYRSNQLRVDVAARDGQLEETITYEPLDASQQRVFRGFSGGSFPFPPRRLAPVTESLFAPAGVPLEMLNSVDGRLALVSFHGDLQGRPTHRSAGGKMARRAQS
jgi:CubicO group peptidase (beta-lactamase class C family)